MSARDLIQEALHSLEANKGRSLLTILGIVIGIASVIAIMTLGDSISRADRDCRQRVYRVQVWR